MDPITLMKINITNFTKSELKIMEYSMQNLNLISTLSIVDFASAIDTSKSAVSRFCQKLGYSGYSQFKYEVKQYSNKNKNLISKKETDSSVASEYASTILKLNKTLNEVEMDKFKSMLLNARRAKVFGVSETGLTADYFEYRLASHGYDIEAVTQSNLFEQKVLISESTDVLVFFSLSANTVIIKNSIELAIQHNIPTVLVTQNSMTQLKNKVQSFLLLPYFDYSEEKLILDSQVVLLAFCSIFINYLKNS